MPNPNPYKDYAIPNWLNDAWDNGDKEEVMKHFRFLLHSKTKFEKAYGREYYRRKKIEKEFDDYVKQSCTCGAINKRP